MKAPKKILLASTLISLMVAGVAHAAFAPKFELKLSDTKVLANPTLDIHLEFSEEDEEIGNFQLLLPKGFNIAGDEEVPNDEEIGGGTVQIEAGPGCRPGSPVPVSGPVNLSATLFEKARTDDEVDAGVHAVWLLDLEPANRVRLLITGSKLTGWKIEGAPTPSDNTCNPLTVDLKINGKSESEVPLITNPKKPRQKVITANIISQDSPSVATFKVPVQFTR